MTDIKQLSEKLKHNYLKRATLKLKGHNFFSSALRKVNKVIRALEEGAHDYLSQAFIEQATNRAADINNYDTYEKQVLGAYEMYNGTSTYGAELLGAIIDARVSFIGGEGISISAEKPATEDFLKQFIKDNRLDGSRFIDTIRTGELEGKNLLILNKDMKKESKVKITSFRWKTHKYVVHADGYDKEEITSITYKKDGMDDVELKENYVFVRLGGTWDKVNDTPPKIAKVLTDIENFSRAKYDSRKSNHLFGRVTPWMQTESDPEAAQFRDAVQSGQWEIGDGYAGSGMLHLVAPDSDASKVIYDEMVTLLRIISTGTSIPIHWLAHPDLMSNRATAENLIEVVKAGTQLERKSWEEALEVVFRKAMDIAVNSGWDNDIIGPFEVKLPFVSLAEIKTIVDALKKSVDSKYISVETYQQKLPGIDPDIEKKRLEAQRKEEAERAPDLTNQQTGTTISNNEEDTENV
jgi:hypothetical protein